MTESGVPVPDPSIRAEDAADDPHDVGAGAVGAGTTPATPEEGDAYVDSAAVEATVDGASVEAEDAREFDRR